MQKFVDVVKEDMKVCNRLKMEAADWLWPPKGSGNSLVFFPTAALQSLKIHCPKTFFCHLQNNV